MVNHLQNMLILQGTSWLFWITRGCRKPSLYQPYSTGHEPSTHKKICPAPAPVWLEKSALSPHMSQFKRCGRKDLQIIIVYSYIYIYTYIVLIGIWTVSDNQETLFSHGFLYEKWPRPWYKVGSQHDLGSPKIQLHTLTMRRSFVRASSCSRSKDGKGLADKKRGFGHPAITNRIPCKRQLMGICNDTHTYIYIYRERERDQYDMI